MSLRRICLFELCVEPGKELVIAAIIYFPQFYDDACAYIQLAAFIFGIGRAPYITAAALKLGAKLFLRQSAHSAQTAQIIAHIAVTPDFLLHILTNA